MARSTARSRLLNVAVAVFTRTTLSTCLIQIGESPAGLRFSGNRRRRIATSRHLSLPVPARLATRQPVGPDPIPSCRTSPARRGTPPVLRPGFSGPVGGGRLPRRVDQRGDVGAGGEDEPAHAAEQLDAPVAGIPQGQVVGDACGPGKYRARPATGRRARPEPRAPAGRYSCRGRHRRRRRAVQHSFGWCRH